MAANPATAATTAIALNINFSRGFGKRKIGRPETQWQVLFKVLLDEVDQDALEVCESDIRIHRQAFQRSSHSASVSCALMASTSSPLRAA